jgi:beta-lactam-binding protein with PASTA domain
MKHPIVNPASFKTLADYMKDKPREGFPRPTQKMAYGDQRSIPDVTCDSVDSARSRLRSAGFEVDVQAGQVDSRCPANTVAGTSPSGRTIKGGFVMIQISNGKNGEPPPGEEPGGDRRPPGR